MWAKSLNLSLVTGSAVAASVVSKRSPETYNLYAYGESIGGLPLYYADVYTGSSGPLVGNPANSTGSDSGKNLSPPSFSDQQMFVPSTDSSSHQVGRTRNASSEEVTSKFIWYGHFLLVEIDNGEYTSLFYTKKNSNQEGAYSLLWNITENEDEDTEYFVVSMRSIAPSNS
ncbi:uncharacterized protein N7511_005988 [Penicillium nucicola]|uniref:uncharacterized protein n=1 Tax=Penicillium nucicola TaxID=1850975 RepID=UPI002545771F|nr:uncharacterized protein N7511_005988 [Penicillium nucicola]KAJ5757294.1 hypothetical protein N7511_005988 [Penicillium nucicola]